MGMKKEWILSDEARVCKKQRKVEKRDKKRRCSSEVDPKDSEETQLPPFSPVPAPKTSRLTPAIASPTLQSPERVIRQQRPLPHYGEAQKLAVSQEMGMPVLRTAF